MGAITQEDFQFMNLAYEEARQGYEEGGVPVGSVMSYKGALLSKGHNKRVQESNPIAHGEMNCIYNAGRRPNYKDVTLYTTKRDDLAALEVAKEGVALDQKLNQANRVSKSDLHLYSLYDPIYKEGYKVTFEIALSLEQTSYEAKRRDNLIKHSQIALERELKEREIENELLRLYKQRESLQNELSQQRELVYLSNKLLDALKKRFELGSATLEDIVREEIRFLETQESLFHLQNDLIVNAKAIEMQMNTLVSKSYI